MAMTLGPLGDTAMVRSTLNEVEIKARQREIETSGTALNGTTDNAAKEKKLRTACEGFEALFIQKMWEGMRASLPKDGMITGSRDEKMWQSMYDQELGKSMASAGGIGLADMMMSQLSRNLQSASDVAAMTARRTPMDIEPVPLVSAPMAMDGGTATEAAKAEAKPLLETHDLYSEAAQDQLTPEAQELLVGGEVNPNGQNTALSAVEAALRDFAAQTAKPTSPVSNVIAPPPSQEQQFVYNSQPRVERTAPIVTQQTGRQTITTSHVPNGQGITSAPMQGSTGTNISSAVHRENLSTGPDFANPKQQPVEAVHEPDTSTAEHLLKEQLS